MPLDQSDPLPRLRTIARSVLRHEDRWAFGLTLDDLVSAGWLAYQEASERKRSTWYPFERARFAMLDEIRRWYDLPANGHSREIHKFYAWESFWPDPFGEIWRLSEIVGNPDPGAGRPRLTREQEDDFTAVCRRLLSENDASLVCGLVLEQESLEIMAERLGKTRKAAAVARSKAIRTLTTALAA